MEPEGPLPHSQESATCPYPKPDQSSTKSTEGSVQFQDFCELFVTWLSFYGEKLSAHRPTPNREEHLLSAVCDCLFNIFAATLRTWRPFLHPKTEDAPCRGDRAHLLQNDINYCHFFTCRINRKIKLLL